MKTSTFYSILFLIVVFSFKQETTVAQAVLDANQIRTVIKPNNSMFWDLNLSASYEVPKGSGKHSMFLGNLWLLGKNSVTENLQGFADRYLQGGSDTWTGPLKMDGSASTTSGVVSDYERVWKLNRTDIDLLIAAQNNGTLASGLYVAPTDILEWPANGPIGYTQQLAPFFDANADGVYDIQQGDYPIMKGEQMLYWILNDNRTPHHETNVLSMGVEIHISLYACKNLHPEGNEDIINYTTFLEYEIFNRSNNTYNDVYAGFNTDCDVGYAFDDYVGSHVDANAFYFYNGDEIDGPTSNPGPGQYGVNSPVQSIQFLEGFENNGQLMSSFMSYDNSPTPTGDPEIGQGSQYYNYLHGYWKNGSRMVFGGSGFPGSSGASTVEANFMFPGVSDPTNLGTLWTDPGFEWSEESPCPSCLTLPTADQRGVGATGPFTLGPNGSVKVVLGLISTFDSTLTIPARVQKNRQQAKLLKQWYDADSLPCEIVTSSLSNDDLELESALSVYPNPANDLIRVLGKNIQAQTSFVLLDINGRSLFSGIAQQDGFIELHVEDLSSGIYFIRLVNITGAQKVVKFVKE